MHIWKYYNFFITAFQLIFIAFFFLFRMTGSSLDVQGNFSSSESDKF